MGFSLDMGHRTATKPQNESKNKCNDGDLN